MEIVQWALDLPRVGLSEKVIKQVAQVLKTR